MKARTIITTTTIGIALAIASQAGAWMGGGACYDCDRPMMGQMMYNNATGPMMHPGVTPALTPDEQARIDAVTADYTAKLKSGETAIQKKIAELDQALADKNTTVAEARTLRGEIYNLKRDYRQTRMELNRKIAATMGRRYYGAGGWGPRYCALDGSDMGGMRGRGRMMGYGRYCR